MPKIDDRMISKLEGIVDRYRPLGINQTDEEELRKIEDRAACRAWLASALHAVEAICPPSNAYRLSIERTAKGRPRTTRG